MIIAPIDGTLTPQENYYVRLPAVPINLAAPHIVSSSKTIGGKATLAIWPGVMAGEIRVVTVRVDSDRLKILRRIQTSGVYNWSLRVQGRVFRVTLNITSEAPDRRIRNMYMVELTFYFLSEESPT